MHASDQLLFDAVRRTYRQFLWVALLAVAVGLPMAIAIPMSGEPAGLKVTGTLFGVVFVLSGGVMLRLALQHRKPADAPIMKVLRERPEDVVWIYVEEVASHAAGATVARSAAVKVATPAKVYTLSVKYKNKDAVLAILGRYAPHATVGYSRELAKQFKRDPRSLGRAA